MIEPNDGLEPTATNQLIEAGVPATSTGTAFAGRLGRTPDLRVGAVVVAGAALVLSAALTMAASPSPAPSGSTGGTSGDSLAPNVAAGGAPGWSGMTGIGRGGRFGASGPAMMGPGGFGMMGPGSFAGAGLGQITIAAINGSSLSLKTADGWTRTITITQSTTITRGGQTIAAGDLKVGDTIRFRETRDSSGTYTITAIDVVVPQVQGTVGTVSGSSFTVKGRDGTTTTVNVTGSTTYQLGRSAGTKADVKAGVQVVVQGTKASDGSLTATSVRIALPTVVGQVTAKSTDSITVTRADGTTMTIKVSGATTYRIPGKTTASLADIAVGMRIVAQGTQNADGSLQASAIQAGPASFRTFPGWRGAPGAPTTPGASTAPRSQG